MRRNLNLTYLSNREKAALDRFLEGNNEIARKYLSRYECMTICMHTYIHIAIIRSASSDPVCDIEIHNNTPLVTPIYSISSPISFEGWSKYEVIDTIDILYLHYISISSYWNETLRLPRKSLE